MMSLHRSMHSSQMYTPGPAMSFFTCFCDLPQKLHFTRSPPSPNFATVPPLLGHTCSLRDPCQLASRDHLVDDAVLLGLFRAHDEVAVGVLLDLVDGLARVLGQHLVQEISHTDDLLGLQLDVSRLTGGPPVWLVDEDPGVRQGEALALGAGSQQDSRRRGGLAVA